MSTSKIISIWSMAVPSARSVATSVCVTDDQLGVSVLEESTRQRLIVPKATSTVRKTPFKTRMGAEGAELVLTPIAEYKE
jgi:hypothetical protein